MLETDSAQKGDKREAILQAALELVAEHGLQHTPMSLISKRAKASAGIIYHYFENKEDLIQSLYSRVKRDLERALMSADDLAQPVARRFQSVLLNAFRYCISHPQEMAFLEQCESLPMPTPDDPFPDDQVQALHGLWADLHTQDLIKDLPDEVIGEFTLAVMRRLARQSVAGVITLDETMLLNIVSACWDAIAR